MIVSLEERVEQAFRHLRPDEAKKVKEVLRTLEVESFETIRERFQIHKLVSPGEQVFVLRATQRLRILFRYGERQELIIEDIVSHDILQKYFHRGHG
jgi:hypothetical protein